MDKRMFILLLVLMILAFLFGFRRSYLSGIQPGYFEKPEAPAYGVGGGEPLGAELGEEFQKYLKELYEEE